MRSRSHSVDASTHELLLPGKVKVRTTPNSRLVNGCLRPGSGATAKTDLSQPQCQLFLPHVPQQNISMHERRCNAALVSLYLKHTSIGRLSVAVTWRSRRNADDNEVWSIAFRYWTNDLRHFSTSTRMQLRRLLYQPYSRRSVHEVYSRSYSRARPSR